MRDGKVATIRNPFTDKDSVKSSRHAGEHARLG